MTDAQIIKKLERTTKGKTAAELGTTSTVMKRLEAEGLVHANGTKPTGMRGRPPALWFAGKGSAAVRRKAAAAKTARAKAAASKPARKTTAKGKTGAKTGTGRKTTTTKKAPAKAATTTRAKRGTAAKSGGGNRVKIKVR